MEFIVRRALERDVAKVAALFDAYRVFYGQNSDSGLAHEFLSQRLSNNESVIFFAENTEGVCVGFTQLYPSFSSISARRSWILNDLYVAPSARCYGVGKQLMEAARNLALSLNAKGLSLQTEVKNVKAQRLYESLGYQKNNDSYFYYLTL